jgi:hypothetical protein
MNNEIINRVASSGIITLDLEDFYVPGIREQFDLQVALEDGMILREKSFRAFIKDYDWKIFEGKHIAVHCSTDALIPSWAYMLVGAALQPYAATVVFGNSEQLEEKLFMQGLSKVDWQQYENARVVVKGCSKVEVPQAIYLEASLRLRPVALSIMFGEACSSVPVFKKK